VQGLVLGMNLQRLDVAPQSMEKRLDRLQSQVGLPLHIRNLAVSGENLEAQADMIRDYMLLFFSRPEVVSLSLGELWSPALINARMGFYEADFQPRPAAAMVMKLLQDWQTEAVLVTDAEGRAEFTPYLGEYAISVEQGGRQWQQKFRLSAEQKAGEIVFELGAGQEQ
jgi:hypothetical protein